MISKLLSRLLLVVGLGAMAWTGDAYAQRGGGFGGDRGGGFDRGAMQEMRTKMEAIRSCPVDMMWAALSFEIEMTDDQRAKISPVMKDAWKMRRDVFAFSEEHDAWGEGRKRMRDLRKKTDARIEAALGKDQWKAYEKALEKLEKLVRQEMPGGRF